MSEERKPLEDKLGDQPLSLSNVDLPTLRDFLEDVENLIRGDRPNTSLADSQATLESGSLKLCALVLAGLADNFNFEMAKLSRTGDLDKIEPSRAKVVLKWQARAQKSLRRKYFIGPEGVPYRVAVLPQNHYQHRSEHAWVTVEKYLTGQMEDAGGRQDPNIHLLLPDAGKLQRVSATREQLGGQPENLLYKEVTLLVRGEQHLLTKDFRNLQLIHFVKPPDKVDQSVLEKLWQEGREAWKDVPDAALWVEELRGNF